MTAATLVYEKSYGGDLKEVFRNPIALITGIVAMIITMCMLTLLALFLSDDCVPSFEKAWVAQGRELYHDDFKASVIAECDDELEDTKCIQMMRADWIKKELPVFSIDYNLAVQEACPAETANEDEFEIEFEPGALTKLGEEIEEPEKVIIQDTRVEEETIAETVTEEEKAEPKVEEKEPEPDPKPKPEKPPPEKQDKKLPVNKIPTKKNTPYNDLPTVKTPKGDPFGDRDGWSDLKKEGDPWATAVMKALNNMPVGAYAAKGGKGNFKFSLKICKDGTIDKVTEKGGSLPPDGKHGVILALNQLKIPKPPAKVASQMKGRCANIKYTFVWSAGGVR
jgi:hypothetical protein